MRGSGPSIRAPSRVDRAADGFEQTGDQAKERRLAAAVRTDEGDDAAARHGEIDVVEDREVAAVARREPEVEAAKVDRTGQGV